MNYSTLTLTLVAIFFALNLVVGLWFGRKSTDIKDYALANKSYGVGPLVMTYLATVIGGGWIFRYPKDIFEDGIGTAMIIVASVFSIFLRARLLTPRMNTFRDCLSLGDMIRKLYGDESGVLAGVLSVTFNTMATGMQVACLGTIFSSFLGVSSSFGVVVSALILGVYTAFGGMRAVTSTDVFQFVFLVITLTLISVFVVIKAGSLSFVFYNLPTEKLDFWGSKKLYYYMSIIILEIFFFSEMVNPPKLDRLLMASSPHFMKKMLNLSGWYILVLFSLIVFIAFSCIVHYPDIDSGNIMLHLVNNVLPDSVKSIAVVGIISALLSSCDSCMHSASVSMSHNVIKPLLKREINEIFYAKLSIVLVVALSIWFAIWGKSFLRLDVYMAVVAPVLAAPLLFGIFGINPEKKAFWISAAAAVSSLTLCKMMDPRCYPIVSNMAVVIATCTSAITYLAVNMQMNGGLYYIETDGYSRSSTHMWTPRPKRLLNILTNILTYPFYFAKRCTEKLQQHGAPFEIFGAFYSIALVLPYFLWAQEPSQYSDLILYLRLLGVFLCALLMTVSIWPRVTIKYLAAFWFISLTYCLPFLSTIVLLLTHGSMDCILNIAITIMFLLLLVDWASGLTMGIIGSLLATLLYRYAIIDPHEMSIDYFGFSTKYLLIYQIILASTIGLLFSGKRGRALNILRLLNTNLKSQLRLQRTELKEALTVEERMKSGLAKPEIDLGSKVSSLETLYAELITYAPKENSITEKYREGLATIQYIEEVIKKAKQYLKLKVRTVELDTLLSFINGIATIYSSNNFSIVTQTDSKEIECDPEMLIGVLYEAICSVSGKNPNENNLMIDISDTKLRSKLQSLPNYEKMLDAYRITITTEGYLENIEFKEVYECEFKDPKSIPPLEEAKKPDVVTDIMNQRILAAHFGTSEIIDSGQEYTHIYVVPKYLRAIRHLPLDLDLPSEVIVTWPGALDLENTLRTRIKETAPQVNLNKLDKALEIIKKYHFHQTRKSGEPYYLHPVNVALIELEFSQEEDAILGALMHDLLEDTAFTIFDIKAAFGDRVAEIVFGVSKLDIDLRTFHSNREHLMTLEKLNDFAVLSIKISDRIHNMRTISGHKSVAKREAIARETLAFFVPLAKKLGLDKAYGELERLGRKELRL